MKRPNENIECACGCGMLFPRFDGEGRPRRYIHGHNARGKVFAPEEREAVSAGLRRMYRDHPEQRRVRVHPRSPETQALMSARLREAYRRNPELRRTGKRHHGWKGGYTINKDGYREVLRPEHPAAKPNGYVLEHRLVMEQHLGRLLLPEEVVHHIDGNKTNNVLENLALMSRAEHTRLHPRREAQ